MPEYCTCGTKLVEDARFCHRCGRPTRELIASEEVEELARNGPPPIPQAAAAVTGRQPVLHAALAQLPVSFSNPVALRVAFLMSLALIPVELVPGLDALMFVWWTAAGWCAVLLYRRLTGTALSVGGGAKLGSIAGVLTFVGLAISVAIKLLVDGQAFFDQVQTQLEQAVKTNPDALKMVHEPIFMFMSLLFALGALAAVVVGLCAAGGALGARFTARKANS